MLQFCLPSITHPQPVSSGQRFWRRVRVSLPAGGVARAAAGRRVRVRAGRHAARAAPPLHAAPAAGRAHRARPRQRRRAAR